MPAPSAPSLYWPDEFTLSTFQLLLDSLTGTTDFAVAAVSVVRDGWLHAVGAVQTDERASWQLKAVVPASDIEKLRSWGEPWGAFTYVSHERVAAGRAEFDWVIEPDAGAPVDDDSWGPLSLLFAPFHTEGELVGMLWVDLPHSGRLPSAQERTALDRFAKIIGNAVTASGRRGAVIRRLELAESTRAMVRAASLDLDLDPQTIFARISDMLLASFGLESAWARIFATPDAGEAVWVTSDAPVQPPDMNSRLGDPVATSQELWRHQTVGILYADGELVGLPTSPHVGVLMEWLHSMELSSQALVPLGYGDTCVGGLSLVRRVGAPRWDDAEIAAAEEIGRDLGQVIRLSQAYAREQATVRRLQELDAYRSRFVAMVSHELKNPLTSILANLELLDDVIIGDPTAGRAAASVNRAARRMTRLVDDLLLLSRAVDPERPVGSDLVDLTDVIREVCDLTETGASQRDLDVRVRISPYGPLTVAGDAGQLDRMVVNLVSNALKYTPDGRSITIGLCRVADEIELEVADEGIGISEQDQARLFTEFFRSADPHVTAQTGTGLGLAIVQQIVRRHGGRVEVESALGQGSTFRVRLPTAEPRKPT